DIPSMQMPKEEMKMKLLMCPGKVRRTQPPEKEVMGRDRRAVGLNVDQVLSPLRLAPTQTRALEKHCPPKLDQYWEIVEKQWRGANKYRIVYRSCKGRHATARLGGGKAVLLR